MASTRVLLRDRPNRAIALATDTHVLIFRPNSTSSAQQSGNTSTTSLPGQLGALSASLSSSPRCIVELAPIEKADLNDYRVASRSVHGCLGLITIDNDVFLCAVGGAAKVSTLRPGETVQRILGVEFYCLNRSEYDHLLNEEINVYPTDNLDEEGYDHAQGQGRGNPPIEHPCLALKKLLSGGSFYYSADFDLTSRLQERSSDASVGFDTMDSGYLWNSYMISPLLDFRSRLSELERTTLDSTRILTAAIRGFASTMSLPAPSSPARQTRSGLPSTLTLISRLSCRRAGTRFNSRGIDDDGNVANFVETETVFWSPDGICFSYVQIRGSVPMFWEQTAGLLPAQQKVSLTRSPQATQPAFDRHFEALEVKYGPIHVVNLLSKEKPGEVEISRRYADHVKYSSLNKRQDGDAPSEHSLLRETHYDFHAETRATGYEAARGIRRYIQDSIDGFGYCLAEDSDEGIEPGLEYPRSTVILQQDGVFRTNCLDCLDRTNLMQTIISQFGLESFLDPRGEHATGDFLARHGTLWADNGDALSKIYAGTGALKSSFTRSGKMSFAGALADARKSVTRTYINNFADKGRQTVMDILLGRMPGQNPVYLFDPINDYVASELTRRASEYSSSTDISIWTGTYNLKGRSVGLNEDLSPWLCPPLEKSKRSPDIVVVGFQEIVELSPQHIMSTEPTMRQAWEKVVKRTLNTNSRNWGQEEYVLLRGGQLVGASLSIFVKVSLLHHIKNVEGSLKKTGMSGMAGNKGAVAIRMDIDNTSCCFVTAHLAAGFANYEDRNRDYHTISHGLKFLRNRSIDDHDTVIWLGDFNYRIGLSFEKARHLAQTGDYGRLYENDQLNLQMVAGLTFPHYSETRILFKPTYKYDLGTDEYDTSEKGRIPAWTDRILRKGTNIRQLSYDCAPLRFSDHRPVYADFSCTVNVVDEKVKSAMSKEIYNQRRAILGKAVSIASDESEDEDLLGYESVAPGLPPASSGQRKWWLDNGLPARSMLQPPSKDQVPNPSRPTNPFQFSDQPDWIARSQLAGRGIPPALPARNISTASSTSSLTSSRAGNGVRQISLESTNSTGQLPHRSVSGLSTASTASTASSEASNSTVIHKASPAPAVPRKPASLSSPAAAGSPIIAKDVRARTDAAPAPPPPGRPGAASSSSPRNLMDDDDGPALPPRGSRANGSADDLADKDALSGWAPLKPT